MKRFLFNPGHAGFARDLGLLMLRLAAAASLLGAHGWGKLTGFAERAHRFPDPLHLGNEVSMALAIFAEVVCAATLILGLAGRWSAVVVVGFFGVAFFMIHSGDPFRERELAYVYLIIFTALALTGPGRFSLDGLLRKR